MPLVAKFTTLAVTSIVVFGTDTDVLRAVPLGLFAGLLTTIFATLLDDILPIESVPQPAPQVA